MKEIIITYLPYVLSAITAYTMLLAGDKKLKAWIVGLGNQVLWLTWILASGTYGLLPMTAVMCLVYWRNYKKWSS